MRCITDVIEDLHISDTKCCLCKHYLSGVPIITNMKDGSSICSRCVIPTTSMVNIRNNWLEILARQFNFPCCYAVDGCGISKPFQDINEHEKVCSFHIYKCCSWVGNPVGLITHYDKNHKNLLIENNGLVKFTEDPTLFLYRMQRIYFIGTYKCYTDHFTIELVGMTAAINDCGAVFNCKVLDIDRIFEIELGKTFKFPRSEMLPTFVINGAIPIDAADNLLKSIVCSNCSISMTPPILKCLEGHVTCLECITPWLDLCRKCDTESKFECIPELECLSAVSMFSCRWKCRKIFNVNEIRDHEWRCEKRLYKCFYSFYCDWEGYLNEFILHEAACYSEHAVEYKALFNKLEVSFYYEGHQYMQYYLLTNNYRFEVSFSREEEYTYINVDYLDIHSLGQFKFEADIIFAEPNGAFNRTSKLEYKNGATYEFKISKDELMQDVKCMPYEIIVRLIVLSKAQGRIETDSIYKCLKNYNKLLY